MLSIILFPIKIIIISAKSRYSCIEMFKTDDFSNVGHKCFVIAVIFEASGVKIYKTMHYVSTISSEIIRLRLP